MFSQLFNWRTLLASIGIMIVLGTVFYSNYLANKIEADEKNKMNVWKEAMIAKSETEDSHTLNLCNIIAASNTEIPIIATNENDSIIGCFNIDSTLVLSDTQYLKNKLKEFSDKRSPILVTYGYKNSVTDKFYYGDSLLLNEVRFYPLVQLLIVLLFVIIMLVTISTRNKSAQNQVWAGMAKETAHQLGTPISSLQGWVEMLREKEANAEIAGEMHNDIERLRLISERFGKIGSKPQLTPLSIVDQVESMVHYIQKRSSEKVKIEVKVDCPRDITAHLNGPLFDWVIENLLKNALDSMVGKGKITVNITATQHQVHIDVTDTGKGISKKHLHRVFKPGFTTKKRGWGLGLSLSRRIIHEYHKGKIYVKSSEIGKGTTFRIELNKENRIKSNNWFHFFSIVPYTIYICSLI